MVSQGSLTVIVGRLAEEEQNRRPVFSDGRGRGTIGPGQPHRTTVPAVRRRIVDLATKMNSRTSCSVMT